MNNQSEHSMLSKRRLGFGENKVVQNKIDPQTLNTHEPLYGNEGVAGSLFSHESTFSSGVILHVST